MPVKAYDFGIIIPALAIVAASFFYAYSGDAGQSGIRIKGEHSEWLFPLDAHETVTVAGPLGATVIAIHGKQAQVLFSPCQNQSCVAGGAIDSPGQWAACLPNKVLLTIAPVRSSADEPAVDAASW